MPGSARLAGQASAELAVRPASDKNHTGAWDVDIPTWVRFLHQHLNALSPGARETYGKGTAALDKLLLKTRVVPCTRVAINIGFILGQGLGFSKVFHLVSHEAGPPALFSDLPAEYRRAAYDEWNKLDAKQ